MTSIAGRWLLVLAALTLINRLIARPANRSRVAALRATHFCLRNDAIGHRTIRHNSLNSARRMQNDTASSIELK